MILQTDTFHWEPAVCIFDTKQTHICKFDGILVCKENHKIFVLCHRTSNISQINSVQLSSASFTYSRTPLCCRSAKFSLARNTIVQIWHSAGGGDDADDMHLIELFGRISMKGTFSVAIISRTPTTSTRQRAYRATKRDENRPFNIYLPQHNLYVAH